MAKNIEKLINFTKQINVAESILKDDDGENKLRLMAIQVIEDFDRDLDSMSEWSQSVEDGQKVAKPESNAKSQPWEGASNYKTPDIIEASVAFGDRATTELLRGDIMKTQVVGSDQDGIKRESSVRVATFMNWQLQHQMENWIDGQEQLFYQLPPFGSGFKKTFFDPLEGINKSELINYPDFVVNQAKTSMNDGRPFSQTLDVSKNQLFERQSSGLWMDVEIYAENTDGDEGSNEQQEVENSFDNDEKFIEQHTFFDLDEDGYAEPYVITVHQRTHQVLRIVPRYDLSDIMVKDDFGAIRPLQEFDSPSDVKLVRIIPQENITHYKYIPNPDGTFLGIGYYHLLVGLSKAINSTVNQLSDAGTLATLQGGFLARGFRKMMGNLKVKPGAWESTDISAEDLHSGILPHPFKEPSATLLALEEKLENRVKQIIINTDFKGLIAPNAPATTTLALIQEAILPTSAILQRVIRAETKEFKKLFLLNSKFADPATYQKVLDDPNADFEQDFNDETMDVLPTANPEMSSKIQRSQIAEAVASRVQEIALTGGDARPVMEFWFDAIGAKEIKGQVYPDPEQVTEEQQARIQTQKEEARKQAMLQAIEVDHAERKVEMEEAKTEADIAETASKIQENESKSILNLEQAESEDVKNKTSVYTTQLQGVRQAADLLEEEIEIERNDREISRENT